MRISQYAHLLLVSGLWATACQPAVDKKPVVPAAEYAGVLKKYATASYNQRVGFFLDLSRPSGQQRFFVVDLKRRKVLAAGLCCSGRTDAHGRVLYSNTPDSNCSSRGLAKVSYAYSGRFGRAYKLVGLQKTNSQIFKRFIVLHAHKCVPATAQQQPLCRSQGCPTVNPAFLRTLSTYIDHSAKPILLYTK